MKTGKFLLYKNVPHLIFRIPQKFFFFENFDLKNKKQKKCSTCLHFNTGLKLAQRDFFGKVDMYWHLYWEILRSIISGGLDRGDVSGILGTVLVLLEVVGLPEQFDTFL